MWGLDAWVVGVCTNIFCVMWGLGGWVVGVCTNSFCVMWNLGGWVVGVISFWPEDQMPTHTRIGFHLLVCDIFLIYWPNQLVLVVLCPSSPQKPLVTVWYGFLNPIVNWTWGRFTSMVYWTPLLKIEPTCMVNWTPMVFWTPPISNQKICKEVKISCVGGSIFYG